MINGAHIAVMEYAAAKTQIEPPCPLVAPRRYVQSNLSVARQTTRYETAEL